MSAAVSPAPFDRPASRHSNRGNNLVYKSGHLYISSKGLGWKSWKRRWFVLTRTSLVFFKNDPSTHPSKGGDANLTLGGIDLNNSGREWAVSGSSITNSGHVSSVLVRADKKLLTVLFPDGRAFTLKAETVEDVDEWKEALERALQAALPSSHSLSNSSSFQTDSFPNIDMMSEQGGSNRKAVKSVIVGRPIVLALEDIDGSPSFLEKALIFLERHGVEVEGILRQSADVEDVERRVREYEQGRNQFSPDEDAHVIGDCIKYLLRELPSSPVPTPCCTALLEAQRLEGKEARIASVKTAVTDMCPDPNRRLLHRVLRMMRAVSTHTDDNRMTASAVAACMAPLLLRPLLDGECGLDDETEVIPDNSAHDNSAQLLAATAAANNAQAIVTSLLEEYDHIFEDDGLNRVPVPPKFNGTLEADESCGEEDDEATHMMHDGEGNFHDAPNDLHEDGDEDAERALSGNHSGSSGHHGIDAFDYKVFEGVDSDNEGSSGFGSSTVRQKGSTKEWPQSMQLGNENQADTPPVSADNGRFNVNAKSHGHSSPREGGKISPPKTPQPEMTSTNSHVEPRPSTSASKRTSLWGLSSVAKKNTDADVNDSSGEEELAIHRLEATKADLRNRIDKEAKGNAVLQASLERRKQALHERRLALEQDVARLQDQLQSERDLRSALEIGLSMSAAQLSTSQSLDSKTRAEVEEIAIVEADVARLKQKVADLHLQLNQQRQQHDGKSLSDSTERQLLVKSLQAQQKLLQQELDHTLALCHQEKQKHENLVQEDSAALEQVLNQQRIALSEAKETLLAERAKTTSMQRKCSPPPEFLGVNDWRTLRPPAGPSAAGRQFAWRHQNDSSNTDDAHSGLGTDAVNDSLDTCQSNAKRLHLDLEGGNGIIKGPPTTRQHPSASAALVELTTRLDFFKERRSQLMDQLNSLDPSLISSTLNGHDLMAVSTALTSP